MFGATLCYSAVFPTGTLSESPVFSHQSTRHGLPDFPNRATAITFILQYILCSPQMIINQPPTSRACYNLCENSSDSLCSHTLNVAVIPNKNFHLFRHQNTHTHIYIYIYMHIDVIYDRARLLCWYVEMGYVMKCGTCIHEAYIMF